LAAMLILNVIGVRNTCVETSVWPTPEFVNVEHGLINTHKVGIILAAMKDLVKYWGMGM